MSKIYLDNSATTWLCNEVSEQMTEFRNLSFGNASSVHQFGQYAKGMLESYRQSIADMLLCEPKEFIFTSGGTEANNFAIKGYAFKQLINHKKLPDIITTKAEHHAVLHTVDFLKSLGANVFYVSVDKYGIACSQDLMRVLRECNHRVKPLVSIMHANNETGSTNDIQRLSEIIHNHDAVFHSDCVQSFGKIPLRNFLKNNLNTSLAQTELHSDRTENFPDMISISAHKIHGPKGIGGLYVSKEIELEPLVHGGSQERNRRGGTEPTELIAGFNAASELAFADMQKNYEKFKNLNSLLREHLCDLEGIIFVSGQENSLPNILNVTFKQAEMLDSEGLIALMDIEGIAVSSGSACTSGSMQPSHVLLSMGYTEPQAKATVRFSFSRYTTEEDVIYGANSLKKIIKKQLKNIRNNY